MIRSCSLTTFTVLLASLAGCGEAPTDPGDVGAMERLVEVPGKVLDFDGARTLYRVATEQWQHEIVRIRDARGRDVTIYDVPSRGVIDARAFLFPAGAIFVSTFGSATSESYPTREAMHEFRDGVTSDLEFDASAGRTSTLAVEGSYAAWTEDLHRPALTLHLRDLVSGETAIIANNAMSHDLSAGGDITYGTLCIPETLCIPDGEERYEVAFVPHGEAPITLGSPSEWGTEPVTDGSTVVFRKANDLKLYGPYQTIMAPVTGGEVALTAPFLGGEWPHADYEVQGGGGLHAAVALFRDANLVSESIR